MKTLIVYASKYGCAADCALYLKKNIPGETVLLDINKHNNCIQLDEFDTVIIGGSIYVGKVSKKLRTFCEKNCNVMVKKNIGIFICGALAAHEDEYFSANFPKEMTDHARSKKMFGSEARLDKLSTFDKLIIKAVTKGDFSNFKLSGENMDAFLKEMMS